LIQDFKRQAYQYRKVSDYINCQGSFSVYQKADSCFTANGWNQVFVLKSLNPFLSIVSMIVSMGSGKTIGFCSFLYLSIQVTKNPASIPSALSASASKILENLACVS